jgi:hypothetical protein
VLTPIFLVFSYKLPLTNRYFEGPIMLNKTVAVNKNAHRVAGIFLKR